MATGEIKKALPADPDGQNADRAEWAAESLQTFQAQTQSDPEVLVTDLLNSIMHWCDRNGQDFTAELERAQRNYQSETWDGRVVERPKG